MKEGAGIVEPAKMNPQQDKPPARQLVPDNVRVELADSEPAKRRGGNGRTIQPNLPTSKSGYQPRGVQSRVGSMPAEIRRFSRRAKTPKK